MPGKPGPSGVAAAVLLALAVLSPWPFGSTLLVLTRGIVLVAAFAALFGLFGAWRTGEFELPAGARWWLGAWLVGALQLVPLPAELHHWLAPGSAAVWHPGEPAAAAVLGPGMRPISIYPGATLRWLAFSAAVVGLALVASTALRTRQWLLRVAVVLTASGTLVALYALVARLFFGNRLYGWLEVPTVAPFGPFVSKNHFAGYVEMTACVAVGLAIGLADEARRDASWLSWLDSRRSGLVVAAWGAAGVLILAVPVSLSRGGMLSLAAGLVALVVMRLALPCGTHPVRGAAGRSGEAERLPEVQPESGQPPELTENSARDRADTDSSTAVSRRVSASHRSSFRVVGVLLITLLVSVIVIGMVLPEEPRQRLATLSAGTGTDGFRIGVWKDSFRLAASGPLLGSGFGAYADALPRFKTAAGELRVEHAENDYVELLCEGGVVGFGLAIGGAVLLFRQTWHGVREEPHRLSRAIRLGALAGLVAIAVHSAFDFNLRIPSNALLAGLVLACSLAPVSSVRRDRRVVQRVTAPERTKGTVVAPEVSTEGRPPHGRMLVAALWMPSLALLLSASCAIGGSTNLWYVHRVVETDIYRAATAGARLRRAALERDVAALVKRRPADARAWLALSWLWRGEPRLEPTATAHVAARRAVALDPMDARIREFAGRLEPTANRPYADTRGRQR